VADLRPDADARHGRKHVHEAFVLQLCERDVRLRAAVGDAEVHERALDVQVRQLRDLPQLIQRPLIVVGEKADAGHARVELQVHVQDVIGPGQRLVELSGVFERVDLLRDVEEDHIGRVLRRGVAQDQDRQADLAAADLHRLFQIGNGQIFRAEIRQRPADRHRAVAVGVRLHHAEEFRALRQVGADGAVVVFQIVERNIRPGPFECLHAGFLLYCIAKFEIRIDRTIRPSALISAYCGVNGSSVNQVSTTSSCLS